MLHPVFTDFRILDLDGNKTVGSFLAENVQAFGNHQNLGSSQQVEDRSRPHVILGNDKISAGSMQGFQCSAEQKLVLRSEYPAATYGNKS